MGTAMGTGRTVRALLRAGAWVCASDHALRLGPHGTGTRRSSSHSVCVCLCAYVRVRVLSPNFSATTARDRLVHHQQREGVAGHGAARSCVEKALPWLFVSFSLLGAWYTPLSIQFDGRGKASHHLRSSSVELSRLWIRCRHYCWHRLGCESLKHGACWCASRLPSHTGSLDGVV